MKIAVMVRQLDLGHIPAFNALSFGAA